MSATNVSQFAQPKKHHEQQCVRDSVSSFASTFRIHKESMILTTLTSLILCHALQRKSEECTKSRGARTEPSLMNTLFLDVFWQRDSEKELQHA